jgi:hypothetical protein
MKLHDNFVDQILACNPDGITNAIIWGFLYTNETNPNQEDKIEQNKEWWIRSLAYNP